MRIRFESDVNDQVGGKLTKDERNTYLELCSQLTSRNPTLDYPSITQRLMDYLRRDAVEKIAELPTSPENKAKMNADLNTIFASTDNEDTNYIGRINIVSLQVIILFTLNVHPIGTPFLDNLNDVYKCYEVLVTKNWMDYNVIKRFLTFKGLSDVRDIPSYLNFFGLESDNAVIVKYLDEVEGFVVIDDFNILKKMPDYIEHSVQTYPIDEVAKKKLRAALMEYADWAEYAYWKSPKYRVCNFFSQLYLDNINNPYTTSTSPDTLIYLITIVDYLSLDEIITSYLENVIICGVASTFLWADGRHLTPFEFLEHDIVHGYNYKGLCYEREGQSRDEMLSFYNFCKNTITDKDTLYSIKFMMFLLIHEGACNFFSKTMVKLDIKDILDGDDMKSFLDEKNLGLSIPKKYRTSGEKVNEFFSIAIMNYLNNIKLWASMLPPPPPLGGAAHSRGGKKSKRIKRTKKSKRTKNRIR